MKKHTLLFLFLAGMSCPTFGQSMQDFNIVANLQGMLNLLESSVESIAEERRLLRKLLLAYIEEKGMKL